MSWEELHSDREEEPEVRGLGSVESNRELIAKFLRGGTEEETESFVQAYFDEIPEDNIKSMMMCQYILMDIYISVVTFGEEHWAFAGEDAAGVRRHEGYERLYAEYGDDEKICGRVD